MLQNSRRKKQQNFAERNIFLVSKRPGNSGFIQCTVCTLCTHVNKCTVTLSVSALIVVLCCAVCVFFPWPANNMAESQQLFQVFQVRNRVKIFPDFILIFADTMLLIQDFVSDIFHRLITVIEMVNLKCWARDKMIRFATMRQCFRDSNSDNAVTCSEGTRGTTFNGSDCSAAREQVNMRWTGYPAIMAVDPDPGGKILKRKSLQMQRNWQ